MDAVKLKNEPFEEKILKYIHALLSSPQHYPVGLSSGKMGFCIYFYSLSRIEQNKEYRHIANLLLDDILERVPSIQKADVMNGLAGIGLGVDYLIKQRYVKGNSNIVLADIDNVLFKRITSSSFNDQADIQMLTQLVYYFHIRLLVQKENSESWFLYKELILYMLNNLYAKVDISFYVDIPFYTTNYVVPQLFYVLSNLYHSGVCPVYLQKMAEELFYGLRSSIPTLNANRLYLLWGIKKMCGVMDIGKSDSYIRLLEQELDIPAIFNSELRDKNIFFKDGLASVYFLLQELKGFVREDVFFKYEQVITNRLRHSDVWRLSKKEMEIFNISYGLYDGYCGADLLKRILNK